MDRLPWEALAMVSCDILHPIQVSLEKNNSLSEFLWLLWVPLYSLGSTSTAPGPRHY
jgi:hypothetical protein